MTPLASHDPRVIESREALLRIPAWRLLKLWRAIGAHIDLMTQVVRENRR